MFGVSPFSASSAGYPLIGGRRNPDGSVSYLWQNGRAISAAPRPPTHRQPRDPALFGPLSMHFLLSLLSPPFLTNPPTFFCTSLIGVEPPSILERFTAR